jgi:hypothetical protein
MAASQILCLHANVTESDALRHFSGFGLGKLYWTLRSGPLQRIAALYVPFWLYRANYAMHRSRVTRWFALDAVAGSLDLFEFPRVPSADQLRTVATRNALPAHLDPAAAEERLREKVLRLIFQQGFFKLGDVNLRMSREPLEFHIPYWLAFHGSANGSAVRCRVLDAVRRKLEGAKASAFFEHWLAQ